MICHGFVAENLEIQCVLVKQGVESICAMVKSRYIGDGHPTFNDGILISLVYKPLLLG